MLQRSLLASAALVLPSLVLAVGCGGGGGGGGGGTDGTTSASGSFASTTISLDNALSVVSNDGGGGTLEVALTKLTTCADATVGPAANDQVVLLSLYTIDSGTGNSAAGSATGTYTTDVTSAGPYVEADVITLDATCNQVTSSTGKFESGTVTITALSATSVVGTLDLSNSGGDTLTGSFTTANCAALATTDSGSGCSM